MARTAAPRKAYSVAEIEALLKEPDRKTINDGAGLVLRKRGTKWLWYYRTTSPETRKDLWISLAPRDPYPYTGLATARQLAKTNRLSVDTGIDPKEEKKRVATATARQQEDEAETRRRAVTLRQVFGQWRATDLQPRLKADGKRLGRKDGGQYVAEQFERHVFPALGDVAMANIRKPDIMAILDTQKAAGKLRTANVLLADLKQLFAFAADREIVEVSPIGHIKKSKVGGDDVERDRTLTEDEIRALPGLIATAGLSKRTEIAIWLILATGVRVGELMGATWSNHTAPPSTLAAVADEGGVKLGTVDLTARQWYIPDTKNQRDHMIHLSDFAVQQFEALASLREHETWIFPDSSGTKHLGVKSFGKQIGDRQRATGKPLKNRSAAVNALSLPGGKWTAHDLRRTAATLMAKIGITGDVINECLNHMQNNRMSRVYIRNRRESEQAIAFDKLGVMLQSLAIGEMQNSVVETPIRRELSASAIGPSTSREDAQQINRRSTTRIYRSVSPEDQVVIVIEALRLLSPPTVTFPNGKSVPIADLVRIVMLSGIKRTTARNWIKAHDGVAWRVTGNNVGLLPIPLDRALLIETDLPSRLKQSSEKLLGISHGFVPTTTR